MGDVKMKRFLLIFIVFVLIITGSNSIVFSEPQYQWSLEDFNIPEDAYDNHVLLLNPDYIPSYIVTFQNTNVCVNKYIPETPLINFRAIDYDVSCRYKIYRINNNDLSLEYEGQGDLANCGRGFYNHLADSNFLLYSEDGSLLYFPGMFSNYYIIDSAMLFDNASVKKLLEMEKKWEKNLNCQFFIYTYKDDIDEIKLMNEMGDLKTSGNGSLFIFIQHRYDGTFRIGIGISKRFGYELPYQPYAHMYHLIFQMEKSIEDAWDLRNSYRIVHFLNLIYQDILYVPDMEMDGDCDEDPYLDAQYKKFYKWLRTDRGLYDSNISSYNLVYGKLSYKCPCEDKKNYIGPFWLNDEYYWQLPGDYDLNHIYFYDVDGYWFNDNYPIEPTITPSPLPTLTPTPIPTPPAGTCPPVSFSPFPTSKPDDGISDPNVIGFLLKFFTLLIRVIGAILGFLLSALTYIFSLRDISSVNHLLTDDMVLGLEWLKQIEIPIFGVTIWSFFVIIFESCLIFVVWKLIRRIIHTAAGSGD